MDGMITIPYHPRPYQAEIHDKLESHRFSVVVMHRRAGKTVMVLNHMIKAALTTSKPNTLYAYIGPYREQSKSIAWRYLKQFTATIPGRKVNESELGLIFPHNGSVIRIFGADNPDALRGLRFDGVVMDEVADMKPTVWQEIIRPALADRMGWCVFIGTPKGLNLFHELYVYALKAETQKGSNWCAVLKRIDETGALPQSEINSMRKEMSETTFRQECLCDFQASSEDVLIPLDIVKRAVERRPKLSNYEYAPLVIGVDVARFGDDTTVITFRKGEMVEPQIELRGADTMVIAGTVARYASDRHPEMIFVDGVGIGAGVVDRLRDLGCPVMDIQSGGKASSDKFVNKRAEMWFDMRDFLRDKGCLPPESDNLQHELTFAHYKYDTAGRLQLERKEEIRGKGLGSPDHADSLALTFAMRVTSSFVASRAYVGRSKSKTTYDPLKW